MKFSDMKELQSRAELFDSSVSQNRVIGMEQ